MKKHFSPILPVIAMSLALCLSGCGSIGELIDRAESTPPTTSDLPEKEPGEQTPDDDILLEGKTLSEDGVLGSYLVALRGADRVELSDIGPALIVYYDFTNNSQQSISPFLALGMNVYQHTEPLDSVKSFDSYPYINNSSLRIRPGVTLRCSSLYKYSEQAGKIEVQLFDWAGDANLVLCDSYDPAALPGEDGGFEIAPVDSPTGTDALARQGSISGCELTISPEHELISDLNGKPCIRLTISLVNGSDAPINFTSDLNACAYQDGVELPVCMNITEFTAEDSNSWQDIASGGSVTVSVIYSLRTQSPVEFEIDGGSTRIGAEYFVA